MSSPETDMLHGHRVSGKEPIANRNRPCGGDETASIGYQLVPRQDGRASRGTRRKDAEKLEESPLRKTEGARRGKINTTEQAMARRVLNRNSVQTEQAQDFESRGLSLTGGYLWQR